MGLLTMFKTAPAPVSVSKAETTKAKAAKRQHRKWRKAHKQRIRSFLLEKSTREELRDDPNSVDQGDLLRFLKQGREREEDNTLDSSYNTCSTQMSSSFSSINNEDDFIHARRLEDPISLGGAEDIHWQPNSELTGKEEDNDETSSTETALDEEIEELNLSMSSISASLPTFMASGKTSGSSSLRHRRLRLSRPSNWIHVTPDEFLEWKQEKDAMRSHRRAIVGQRIALRTLRCRCKSLELPFRRKYFSMDDNEIEKSAGLEELFMNRLMFTAISEEEGNNDANNRKEVNALKIVPCGETEGTTMGLSPASNNESCAEHVFVVTDAQKLKHLFTLDMAASNNEKLRSIASSSPFTTLRYPFSVEC